MEFFKKEGNEYKKMPVNFQPVNCCEMVFNDMYAKTMEKQNVPKSCPIKPVSIITHKSVFCLEQVCPLVSSFICLLICLYLRLHN
jgi:hypothetical protein